MRGELRWLMAFLLAGAPLVVVSCGAGGGDEEVASDSGAPPLVASSPDQARAERDAAGESGEAAGSGGSGGVGGVVDLGDGLRIRELVAGDGPGVPIGARITIEFTAWVVGERVAFDSTERRRRAVSFTLAEGGPIAGLVRGIEGMRAGGTRLIEIPAELAYGETGRDPVPPDADLVYEVTLVSWSAGGAE